MAITDQHIKLIMLVMIEGWEADKVYQNKKMGNHFSSSVLFRDHRYGFSAATLTCLDFRTGVMKWRERGTFGKGSVLVAEGHLVILGCPSAKPRS